MRLLLPRLHASDHAEHLYRRLRTPSPKLKVVMEDVESDDAARDRPVPSEPIREATTATDEEDVKLVYDHTHFWRDKVRHRYFATTMGAGSSSRGEPP
jgi:hypothetical protein